MKNITKAEFKRLHKNGELLLLTALPISKEDLIARIQLKIKDGVNLSDYTRNTTHHGFIDDGEHKAYIAENENIVLLENIYQYGNRQAFNTVAYLTNGSIIRTVKN